MFDTDGPPEEAGDFVQCVLRKGRQTQIAWIPSQFAKMGSVVKIKVKDSWEDGWVVQAAYGSDDYRSIKNNDEARRRMKFRSSIAKSQNKGKHP